MSPRTVTRPARVQSEAPEVPDGTSRLGTDAPNPGGRGEDAQFEQVSWDEALQYVADEMRRVRSEYGPESVFFHTGSGDNGMGTTIFGRLASMFGGTQQSWSIDSNVGVGFNRITGHGFFLPPTNESADWVNANTIIVWGSDLFKSQFQNDASKVLDAIESGAKLVVVDPVYTTTASKADLWLPIEPGKDTHLALAMIHDVLAEGTYDDAFLRERTTAGALVRGDTDEMLRMRDLEGDADDDRVVGIHAETGEPVPLEPDTYAAIELFGEYEVDGIRATTGLSLLEEHVADYSPETVASVADLDPADIKTAARWLATRGPGGIAPSYALGRYKYGHVFGQTYAILLALTGDYGKSGTIHAQHPSGTTLNSGEYGSPDGAPGTQSLSMHEVPAALEDGEPFPIKAIYGMESNMLANQFPNRQRWHDLLENVDMFAMADFHRTPTVQHADIILPAATGSSGRTSPTRGGPIRTSHTGPRHTSRCGMHGTTTTSSRSWRTNSGTTICSSTTSAPNSGRSRRTTIGSTSTNSAGRGTFASRTKRRGSSTPIRSRPTPGGSNSTTRTTRSRTTARCSTSRGRSRTEPPPITTSPTSIRCSSCRNTPSGGFTPSGRTTR